MKRKSIEQLKNEGLVTTAEKISVPDYYDKKYLENRAEGFEKIVSDLKTPIAYQIDWEVFTRESKFEKMLPEIERLIWLNDFLKRYKLKFEDFSIDVETIYSQNKAVKPKKGTKTPKTEESTGNDTGSGKKDRSNWFNDYKSKKTGISK